MKRKILVIAGISLLLFSCNPTQEQVTKSTFAPVIIEAKGYVVPKDSILLPISIPADAPTIGKAVAPKIILTNTNVFIAGNPKTVFVGIPEVIIMGTDTFSLPETVPAIDSAVLAGNPEIVKTKEGYTKDQNPNNFITFGKLQGLKHGNISGILQDSNGNLWLSTEGGGVSKYDGSFFSHLTEKEGLCNNTVFSLLEDKRRNLWFGTRNGLAKYDGISFTTFTELEGLSSSTILTMLEDKNGFLWIGTFDGGVNKYDGNIVEALEKGEKVPQNIQQGIKKVNGKFVKSFTHFTTKEGLSDNHVRSIYEDKIGNLWFGTENGVSRYDGNRVDAVERGEKIPPELQSDLKKINGKLVRTITRFTDKIGMGNNDVRRIIEDKKGNIWFGTNGGGVTKYDGNRVDAIERGGKVTIETLHDLKKLNGKFHSTFSNFTDKEGLSSNYISSIQEDKSGNLWFGTLGGGLNKYNGKYFTRFTDQEGLCNNLVSYVFEDRSRNLWCGTYMAGLSKYNGKSFTHFTTKEGLSYNVVYSILEDKKGNLWFGTYRGGISKYDGKSFVHYTTNEGLSNNAVWSSLEDKKGNIWFGTEKGGINKFSSQQKSAEGINSGTFTIYTDKKGVDDNTVRCIFEDTKGNLWFGSQGGGASKFDGKSFTHYTIKEGLTDNIVLNILEDKNGNLWFGTYNGITKYDGKSFTRFKDKEDINRNKIVSMLEDKTGNLWFCTYGGGVVKYDGKSFTHYTEKEGLINNFVFSMIEDKKGNFWFGTRFGLSKLAGNYMLRSAKSNANPNTEQPSLFKNFGYEDGFLGIGCNASSMKEDRNGTIWIGSNDRLTAFHPEGDESGMDTIPPNIELTSIGLFNEKIPWLSLFYSSDKAGSHKAGDVKDTSITLGNSVKISGFKFHGVNKWYSIPSDLSLAYNNNYVTFNFIGITLNKNKNVKYKYKLEGLDENWSATTNRTEVPYGNLAQGTYTFKVKAMNSEGYASKELNYTFTIRPPWWKTWWSRSLFALFVFISLYSFYRWRTASLREGKKQLEKTVVERTAEIVHQKEELVEKSEALEQSYHSITLLSEIGQKITATLDLEKIMNTVYENVNALIDAEEFGIGILMEEEQIIDMQFSFYQTKRVVINNLVSMKDENRLSVWCIKNKKEIFINDMEQEYGNYVPTLDAYKTNQPGAFILHSLICLPLIIEQKVSGLIYVQSSQKNAYTPIQLEMFRTLATYTAVALNNAEAYKKLNEAMLEVEKLSIVANNAENTVVICNPDAELIWANDAFTRVFGYTLEEFKNERGKTIIEVSSYPNIKQVLNDCIEKRTGISYESKYQIRNNEERWFQSTLSPVFKENNELRNIIIIDSDITERKIAELLLEQKNKEITASITYAKRIQEAILPSDRSVKIWLPDSFILYKPKDIVAGDFYWVENVDDKVIFAAADCTGHGVPGAMVSVVCNNALNRALREFELREPGKLLDKTRELVIEQFEKSNDDVKDGMDISLCVLNTKNNELQWAGANNPLWIIRNNEILITKADKQPIGKYVKTKIYVTHTIPLQKGDSIYVFTDGYADQFGLSAEAWAKTGGVPYVYRVPSKALTDGQASDDANGKKFKASALKELLLSIQTNTMEEQKEIINQTFENWKGSIDQVDDVCMIGVRI